MVLYTRWTLLNPNFNLGQNVIIFWVGNSSSSLADNREKYILVIDEGSTQGLDDTAITTKAEYSINLSQNYNKTISIVFMQYFKNVTAGNKKTRIKWVCIWFFLSFVILLMLMILWRFTNI